MAQTENEVTLPFNVIKQNALLGYLLINERFFRMASPRIKPSWFLSERNSQAYQLILDFVEEYKDFPREHELLNCPQLMIKEPRERATIQSTIAKCISETAQVRLEQIKPELTEWLHTITLMKGLTDAQDSFNAKDMKLTHNKLMAAVKEVSNTNFDSGDVITFSNYQEYLLETQKERAKALTTGLKMLDEVMLGKDAEGGLLYGDTTIIMAPINVGKCEAKGTELIDFNGKIVKIEDVKPGDKLMGPDGMARNVLSTTKGHGPMYKVTPKAGGHSFVCNDVHVLSLKLGWTDTNIHKVGEIVNIPVNEYLTKSNNWKAQHHLWRASLDFSHKELSIDPYILGLWLGDGDSHTAALTTIDKELEEIWSKWVRSNGDIVKARIRKNNKASIYEACVEPRYSKVKSNQLLRDIEVIDNKHVPHIYLTSSRDQRLKLLAGLIDINGYLCEDSKYFEITQKNVKLAEEIAFLARSLGFKVSEVKTEKADQNGTRGSYIRMTIMGPLSTIPTQLARKQGKDGIKNPLTTNFRIEPVGEDDYYGFTLDGDHLYLHKDFTVTHNTSFLVTTMVHNILRGKDVLFMTHEGNPNELRLKILSNILQVTGNDILSLYKDKAGEQKLIAATQQLEKHLKYIPYNKAGGMFIERVVPIIRTAQEDWMANHNGKGFDLLVSDYPAILSTEMAMRGNLAKRDQDRIVYDSYVQLAIEYKFHALLAIQTNREGSKINKGLTGEGRQLEMEDVKESWDPMAEASNVLTLNRPPWAEKKGILMINLAKTRSNARGVVVSCFTDFSKGITHSNELTGWIEHGGFGDAEARADALISQQAARKALREVPVAPKEVKTNDKAK